MNLSKNSSDLSWSPLKIGGGTPESARLPPLLGVSAGGGAGALIVAPMYSKLLVSMGAVAAMLRGLGVVSGACIMWHASLYWVSVSDQCPKLKSLSLSIWLERRVIQASSANSSWRCKWNQEFPVCVYWASSLYS